MSWAILFQILYKFFLFHVPFSILDFLFYFILEHHSPLPVGLSYGRRIHDGILALHETVQEVKVQRHKGVFLKMDFQKAYDRSDWSFPQSSWAEGVQWSILGVSRKKKWSLVLMDHADGNEW